MPKDEGQSGQKDLQDDQTQEDKKEEGQTDPFAEFGEKFKGKSPKEVADMYQNLEKKFGDYDDKIKTLEQEKQAYENWYRQMQNQAQQGNQGMGVGGQYGTNPYQSQPSTQQVPGGDSTDSTSWWDKPDEAARKMFQSELSRYDQQRRYQDAFSRAPTAERLARQQYPDIFEGLEESEVRNILTSGVQNGVIAPDVLANPEGWAMAAGQRQLVKRGFKLSSSQKDEPTDTGTERPDATKKQSYGKTDSVNFNSQSRRLLREFGLSEEEGTEIAKNEKKLKEALSK